MVIGSTPIIITGYVMLWVWGLAALVGSNPAITVNYKQNTNRWK